MHKIGPCRHTVVVCYTWHALNQGSPTIKEPVRRIESIRQHLHSQIERCKDTKIVAERFKGSTKKINQRPADAIVSEQTRCRVYRGSSFSTASSAFGRRGSSTAGTITVMTNVSNGDGYYRSNTKGLAMKHSTNAFTCSPLNTNLAGE